MYTDAQNRPSNGQSLIGAAATTVSTDCIDLLSAQRDIGRSGQPMRVIATVTTALAGGTSVQAQLIESASSDLSSPTVLASGPVVLDATGVAGYKLLDVPMPDTSKRYLGLQYVKVGTHSAGAVSAHVVAGTDRRASDVTFNTGL